MTKSPYTTFGPLKKPATTVQANSMIVSRIQSTSTDGKLMKSSISSVESLQSKTKALHSQMSQFIEQAKTGHSRGTHTHVPSTATAGSLKINGKPLKR